MGSFDTGNIGIAREHGSGRKLPFIEPVVRSVRVPGARGASVAWEEGIDRARVLETFYFLFLLPPFPRRPSRIRGERASERVNVDGIDPVTIFYFGTLRELWNLPRPFPPTPFLCFNPLPRDFFAHEINFHRKHDGGMDSRRYSVPWIYWLDRFEGVDSLNHWSISAVSFCLLEYLFSLWGITFMSRFSFICESNKLKSKLHRIFVHLKTWKPLFVEII